MFRCWKCGEYTAQRESYACDICSTSLQRESQAQQNRKDEERTTKQHDELMEKLDKIIELLDSIETNTL